MRTRARIEVRSCVISPPKHRLILRPRLSYHERLTERDPGGEKPAISGRTENENRQGVFARFGLTFCQLRGVAVLVLNVIQESVARLWDELPDLVGPDWARVEIEVLFLLRRADAHDLDDAEASRLVTEIFEPYTAAWERLFGLMADLLPGDTVRGQVPPLSLGVKRDRHVVVPVYYGTDRAGTNSDKPGFHYGGVRGELSFGVATVSIPDDHRMGSIEKPRWWRLEFRPNPDHHVVLLSIDPMTREGFISAGRQAGRRANNAEALVFVHGYNVTFEAAAQRAAQIAYDLGFGGVPMLFSWPSTGSGAKYTVDETNVRWAEPHYREFLSCCLAELGLRTVHVIAHSMGNRLVAETLGQFDPPTRDGARLRQIVFAAPDIDADTFRQLAAAFHGSAERWTLYASSQDYALKASKVVHGYARAGDSGPDLVVVDGIDTVDATAVDTSLLGHSYYGDNRSILSDIFSLIRGGPEPDDRFGLLAREKGGARYWLFRP